MLEISKNLRIAAYLLIAAIILTSCTYESSKENAENDKQSVEQSESAPDSTLDVDTIYYAEVLGAIKIVREEITKEVDAVKVNKKIKAYKKEIEKIKSKNPNLKYSYSLEPGGNIQSLGGNYRPVIEGIKDSLEIERLTLLLEAWGTDRNRAREYENSIMKVEKKAVPEMGYEELYKKIKSNINYPDAAQSQGVEGTAFIQFDVIEGGEVRNVKVVDTDYDSKNPEIISKLNIQAKDAIMATSGDWVPAKQGSREVATTLEIPVTFEVKKL